MDRIQRWWKLPAGFFGSVLTLIVLWTLVLSPLGWPPLELVARYFVSDLGSVDNWLALGATGVRAVAGLVIGFLGALVAALLTGRSRWGWAFLFFLLLAAQKIPAIAMVHVLVQSRLGLGFPMTVTLASVVVLTFSWILLHHRVRTIPEEDIFALRLSGFRPGGLILFGIIPHLGSAVGATARMGASIALVMVVMGEWQGVWATGGFFEHGLGVEISRAYEAVDNEARVLALCGFLGLLGFLLDGAIVSLLTGLRRGLGVDLSR